MYLIIGVYISNFGKVYKDKDKTEEIVPEEDLNGYLYIPGDYLNKSYPIQGEKTGQYIHRMVVFSFGDCKGKPLNNNLVIDHIDMNHKNNSVENLEQINYGINLFRAYFLCVFNKKGVRNNGQNSIVYKTLTPAEQAVEERYITFRNSLSKEELKIFDILIDEEVRRLGGYR